MIVTVFRTRLNPGVQEEYGPMAKQMSELAQAVPGYISHKGFTADDGERVTIVEFESENPCVRGSFIPSMARPSGAASRAFSANTNFRSAT